MPGLRVPRPLIRKGLQQTRFRPTAEREAAAASRYTSLAFYVTAHEDDWELFRGEQAYRDLATPTKKVVFIYVTAGDAGQTNGWWEAREQGALAAVRELCHRFP